MRIIDAHTHLNMKSDNPIKYIEDCFAQRKIAGCVLILNTQEEKEFFIKNFNLFELYGKSIHIASALDFHQLRLCRKFNEFLENKGIEYSVKLHPRMHYITKGDFDVIIKMLKTISCRSIVIDSFYYGSDLETHIMLELGILLAKKFQNLNIVYAHFGGHKILEMMLCTRNLKNVYYDLSHTQNYLFETSVLLDMRHAIKYCLRRIMFGTDFPDFNFDEAYEKSIQILEPLNMSKEETKLFYSGVAKSVYGVECICE